MLTFYYKLYKKAIVAIVICILIILKEMIITSKAPKIFSLIDCRSNIINAQLEEYHEIT